MAPIKPFGFWGLWLKKIVSFLLPWQVEAPYGIFYQLHNIFKAKYLSLFKSNHINFTNFFQTKVKMVLRDLPKLCLFSPDAKSISAYHATFPSSIVVNEKSLGAPRSDLRGQNWGQIQNLHKILREISLSQLKWWSLKDRWYSLRCCSSKKKIVWY